MKKKFLYVTCSVIVLLLCAIAYFTPIPLSGFADGCSQAAIVWNEIGVKDGRTFMDCDEYPSLTLDQNKDILSILENFTYRRTLGTLFSDGSMPGYYALHIYLSDEFSTRNYILVSTSGEILVHGKTYRMEDAEQFIEQVLEIVE